MKNIIPVVSCTCDETDGILENQSNTHCPKCGEIGKYVQNVTVRHIVKKELIEDVGTEDYYLCMNRKCELAYYNESGSKIFEQNKLKVPLWYKENADPKYACYCSKTTEEDVKKAVEEQNISDISDIRKYYDPDGKCQCKVKNPTGKCCHNIFQNIIDKYTN